MGQDEMRKEINLAEEEKVSNVSHCLRYFTAGYNNARGRADLKHAEKTVCVFVPYCRLSTVITLILSWPF